MLARRILLFSLAALALAPAATPAHAEGKIVVYTAILPVIISTMIAYGISRAYQKLPLFDLLARQDGLVLPSIEERREMTSFVVEDAMRTDGVLVAEPGEHIVEVAKRAEKNKNNLLRPHDARPPGSNRALTIADCPSGSRSGNSGGDGIQLIAPAGKADQDSDADGDRKRE